MIMLSTKTMFVSVKCGCAYAYALSGVHVQAMYIFIDYMQVIRVIQEFKERKVNEVNVISNSLEQFRYVLTQR